MLCRYKKNPIISPGDVEPSTEGFIVLGAFNPGAVCFKDEVILLLRVAEACKQSEGRFRVPSYTFKEGKGTPEVLEFDLSDPEVKLKDTRGVSFRGEQYLSTLSHIRLARSSDGINFKVDPIPFIAPSAENERYGVEDARVTPIAGRYYLNYTIVSSDSWCTALAVTDDFVNVEKLGIIFPPENKDVAIFPERVGGKYVSFHRPNNSGFGRASIWYADSPDLIHWGNHRCLLRPRDTSFESMKIGGGSAPIKTSQGWLTFYHAKGDAQRYSLFGLLLDMEEPWKIIKQGTIPLLQPEKNYETSGFFANVVFTNGSIIKDNRLFLYYGASDETCCLAQGSIDEILDSF